ncbi:hypothetical protein AOR13_3258 [Alteromonas stellipolaris LMG 21856]|nr:hypothetical protein AOR13_3258 [Alteromonas stellipolaris LMG 21856]
MLIIVHSSYYLYNLNKQGIAHCLNELSSIRLVDLNGNFESKNVNV